MGLTWHKKVPSMLELQARVLIKVSRWGEILRALSFLCFSVISTFSPLAEDAYFAVFCCPKPSHWRII